MSLANALTVLVLGIVWVVALVFGEDAADGRDLHRRR